MENKFKGTPGPWHEKDNGHYYDIKCDAGKYGDYNLASTQVNEYTNPPITREIERHNAKLIAAAPDLLENLIRLVDRMEENDLGHMSAVERAKETIKKALGE